MSVNGIFRPTGEDPVNTITLANKLLYLESLSSVILFTLLRAINVSLKFIVSVKTICSSTYGFNYGNKNNTVCKILKSTHSPPWAEFQHLSVTGNELVYESIFHSSTSLGIDFSLSCNHLTLIFISPGVA